MSENRTNCVADTETVTAVLSKASSRTMPAAAADPYESLTPAKAAKMSFPTAWIQEVVWETYNGLNGPNTLLKRVEHGSLRCPECDTKARYDEIGDAVCDDPACGVVVSAKPMLLPEDGFTGRTSGVGKAALNPAQSVEPDVQ